MDILNFKIESYRYDPNATKELVIKGVDGDMEIDIRIKNPTRNALHNCMAAYDSRDSRYSEDSVIIRLEGNHEL